MILITGGCGYLGSHCAVDLIQKGFKVAILDNLINSSSIVIKNIERITKKDVIFIHCDVRDEKKLDQVFKYNNIDTVFHFAGLKSIQNSFYNSNEYFSVNVEGSISLVKSMLKASTNKMIFSSSATIYGDRYQPPWTESYDIQTPKNPYAQSKFLVENVLRYFTDSNRKLSIGVLRYFNPIGYHKSGLIGENSKNPNNLIPAILNVLEGKNKQLEIFGDTYPTKDGSGVRDYLHIEDLINGHIKALKFISTTTGFNVWNLGSGKGYSVFEILAKIEKIIGMKVPFKIAPRRSGDLAEYWSDIAKAREELNWWPQKDLNEMLHDSIITQLKIKKAK